jgi:hypothetical protein
MKLSRGLRELAEFPFTKINPYDFRVQIASAPPTMLTRVLITTSDPTSLAKCYPVKVLQLFPHLSVAVCEVPAGELRKLVESDLVDGIQNDVMKLDVGFGFHLTNSYPRIMVPRAAR